MGDLRYFVAAVLFSLSLVPTQASACGACFCDTPSGFRPYEMEPRYPTNARFSLALHPSISGERLNKESIFWTDYIFGDTAVPFEISDAGTAAGDVWLIPTEDLLPNTKYEVFSSSGGDSKSTFIVFQTGSGLDTSPPEVVTPRVDYEERIEACGDLQGASLIWDEMRDNGELINYSPTVQVDVVSESRSATLYLQAIKYSAFYRVPLVSVLPNNDPSSCWGAYQLPASDFSGPLVVTATVFDQAGNSTRLDPVEVTLVEHRMTGSCGHRRGCSSSLSPEAPNSFAGWLALAGGALGIAFYRRRSRTSLLG
jgi:hypothetical protein